MSNRTIAWYNENSYRAYPFVEDTVSQLRRSPRPHGHVNEFIGFANDVILDFNLSTNTETVTDVYLESIGRSGANLLFTFKYNATDTFVAAVPYAAATPYEYQSFTSDLNICIVFGPGVADLAALSGFTDGVLYIRNAGLILEPCTHRSLVGTCVDSLGTGTYSDLTGNVYLFEGHNCQISMPDHRTIRVAAIRGAGLGINCNPYTTNYPCGDVLLYVNGVQGSGAGDFNFVAGPGIAIEPDPLTFTITFRSVFDNCALTCGGNNI